MSPEYTPFDCAVCHEEFDISDLTLYNNNILCKDCLFEVLENE